MTDRDRLIEILQDTLHEWECDVSIKTLTEIAEHLIENGVIVLPCKVGDTIYKLWYTSCHLGETYPDSYGCDGCYDECDIKKVITEYKVPSLRFIVDELMNGSCVYYLTREEAEKALDEKK